MYGVAERKGRLFLLVAGERNIFLIVILNSVTSYNTLSTKRISSEPLNVASRIRQGSRGYSFYIWNMGLFMI